MNRIDPWRFETAWNQDDFDGAVAFQNMRAEFENARAKHPEEFQESFFVLAGRIVLIRIAGRELAEHFCRPFAHLRTDVQKFPAPGLTIEIWDKNKAAIDGPAPLTDDDLKWGETTLKTADGRFVGQRLPHTISCLDRDAGHIMASIAWNSRIFIYERAKPLARLLLEWHNDQNIPVIHAGLVAREGSGLLIAGKSGSGKSTSSLACVSAGLHFLGEDYVGLQNRADDSFVGHSLYNSVFLNTVDFARFADLAPYAIKGRLPHEEKSVIILSTIFSERLERAVPIRAVALVRVGDSPRARLCPASKGETLLALGPSSLLQIPNRPLGTRGLDRLAKLVERVPCYSVEAGSDLPSVAHCIEELLGQVGG